MPDYDVAAAYDRLANDYARDTQSLDMAEDYGRFLDAMPEGGPILDLGCGAGRDAAAFLELGLQVTAVDPSPRMADLAAKRTGLRVALRRAEDIREQAAYAGIWANGSLHHVDDSRMSTTLERLHEALVEGGVLYLIAKEAQMDAALKQEGERSVDKPAGRRSYANRGLHFNVYTKSGWREMLTEAGFEVLSVRSTPDDRPGRSSQRWIRACAKRPRRRVLSPET